MRGLLILFILCLPAFAHAEIITYTKTLKKIIGTSQSIDDAKVLAVADAKRDIIEQAGTYIRSVTIVENGELKKDEVNALAMGILKTEVAQMQNIIEGDSFGIIVTVKADVDTSTLQDEIKRIREDERLLKDYKELEKRLNEQLAKNAELDKRVAEMETRLETATTEQERDRIRIEKSIIQEEYRKTAEAFSRLEWLRGLSEIQDPKTGKYTDTEKALRLLTTAINNNPTPGAYKERGDIYYNNGSYELSIRDYKEAISRGDDRKITKTSLGVAYKALGDTYFKIKEYSLSDDAYREACKHDAIVATAVIYFRCLSYLEQEHYEKTLDCLEIIVKEKDYTPENINIIADIYYDKIFQMRGLAYSKIHSYSSAKFNYDSAERLNPNNGRVYELRGTDYFALGEKELGCSDLKKACQLGKCDALKHMQEMGYCK